MCSNGNVSKNLAEAAGDMDGRSKLLTIESSLRKHAARSGSWEAHKAGQNTFLAAVSQRNTL